MNHSEDAKVKREMAARARRWAKELAHSADSKLLMRHAEELEREAAELERQAAPATDTFVPHLTRTVIQMQTQQAAATKRKEDDDTSDT